MILAITMNPAIDKIYFVESYALGGVHRPMDCIDSAGGKGLNVARVARLLGEEVAVSGFLGGSNGQYIKEKIAVQGLQNRFAWTDQQTRVCINVTDMSNGQCTEVLEVGPELSRLEGDHFLKAFESMLDDVDVITISGSLPKGIDYDFYSKLIELAHMKEIPVLLDASGEPMNLGLQAQPYLVKPNQEEISKVYKGATETIEDLMSAIRYLKSIGIDLPIVSLGKEGALAGLSDGIYKVSFPSIEVINTVGSGDAFIAGCAVAMVRKYNEIDMLKLAIACGSANTQYAQTGYVEMDKVTEYLNYVKVTKVCD
jgi:tagatose 6-phosphate kinase